MSKNDKKAFKRKTVEGFDEKIEVTRKDYIISNTGGKIKRYLKTDERVIGIINEKGITKYYLKTDPMVTRTNLGRYILTKYAVFCHCIQSFVDKDRESIIKIDNNNFLLKNTVEVDGKRQYFDKVNICIDSLSRERSYYYKKNCILLHPGLYGENKYTLKLSLNQLPVVKISGKYNGKNYYARESDSLRLMTKKGVVEYHYSTKGLGDISSCFVGFINEELLTMDNNIKKGSCLSSLTENERIFRYHSNTDRYVHVNDWDRYNSVYKEWYKHSIEKNVKKAIKKANSKFSDAEESENNPSFMRFDRNYKPRWGGNIGTDGRKQFSVSSTSLQVGGINYTYGVEIETSDGFLSSEELNSVGLCSMGDNSILGNEYITQALHGDVGVEILKNQMNVISDRCVVDDSCAIHVHIGGWKSPKVLTPNFNINFAINVIKLGCMIEEDLFKSQPKSRSPWKKHCHCITSNEGDYSGDFSGINKDNYRDILGRYVFGQKIDRDVNSMATPGRWANMRYKWLNLRNAVSNTEIKTLEFRIFAPTTVFSKVLQAVRISLAFVWFVENRQRLISKGGITLTDVITEAYKRHPDVLKEVLLYVNSRTEKFNRKNIYQQN